MKQNTLLFDLLQSLYSCDELAELARVYEYQDTARKFSSYDLLKFWIAAAIGQWKGFRHGEKQLPTCAGLPSVDHSTLAKKAREVPFEMIQKILQTLIERTSRKVRRTLSLPFPIDALDSTTITVGKGRLPWAHFQGNQSGVKLHVRVNTADQSLLQVEASTARVHDSSAAHTLLQEPHHVVVQDRGYIHGKRLEEMDDLRVFFVVRLRKNMKITHVQPLTQPTEDSAVFQDIVATLQGTSCPFRIVSFHDNQGKAIHVVTNDRGGSRSHCRSVPRPLASGAFFPLAQTTSECHDSVWDHGKRRLWPIVRSLYRLRFAPYPLSLEETPSFPVCLHAGLYA